MPNDILSTPQNPQGVLSNPSAPKPQTSVRKLGDTTSIRNKIFDNTLNSFSKIEPVSNSLGHQLSIHDLHYAGPDSFSIEDQKNAIMTGKSLNKRLRGTVRLSDTANNQLLDEKEVTLAKVPYMTQRGTFILNGNENVLAHQFRLRPGVYTRIKASGELESHVNVAGRGRQFHILLNPAKGTFNAKLGQGSVPLMQMMRALGTTDNEMRQAWGDDVFNKNLQADSPAHMSKFYARFVRRGKGTATEEHYDELKKALEMAELDPEVTKRTLGKEYTNLNKEVLLATTKKLLDVNKGVADVDDRDHLAYQRIVGPEDLFADRISRDRNETLRKLLFKFSRERSLARLQPNIYDSIVKGTITDTKLGQCFDAKTKVLTKRGWIYWPEVNEDDEFACWIDDELTYRKPYKLFRQRYDGTMIRCSTQKFQYLVTPNHRLWCKYHKKKSKYREETAEQAYGKSRVFHTSLPEFKEFDDSDHVLSNGTTIPGDLWAEFLGWFISEGCVSVSSYRSVKNCKSNIMVADLTKKAITISQCPVTHPAYSDEIAGIADRFNMLGVRWNRSKSKITFTCHNRTLADELVETCGRKSNNKRIPRYCFNWSNRRLQILADAYLKGDGNRYCDIRNDRNCISTKTETVSPKLADDLVELFGRLGGTGRICFRELSKKNSNWRDSYVVSFGRRSYSQVLDNHFCLKTKCPTAYSKVHYRGMVYCASVPGEKLYVMRGGKPHWSLNSPEEVSSLELLGHQTKITRLGEGGLSSTRGVPDETRSVSPSHMGYVDLVQTPESSSAGVDLRLASATLKGDDGKLYSPFKDLATGQTTYKTPQEVIDIPTAFPNELTKNRPFVVAMVNGKVKYVPRDTVKLEMPAMEHTFSPTANLVPMKSATKGQRVSMGARMLTQALPLKDAEAPLVRSAHPDNPNLSYEEHYGSWMGAHKAKKGGRVVGLDKGKIKVKYEDGTNEDIELYHNFPYARKTFTHNTPLVGVGDRFAPGQVLAKSNFTDDQGAVAIGKNLRVAYTPWRGAEVYEDAVTLSKSAAAKLNSEHMYQHVMDWDKNIVKGKSSVISIHPGKYSKNQLDTLDDKGVVKPGTVVKFGDPLILASQRNEDDLLNLHKKSKSSYKDVSTTWDHHSDGLITDVAHIDKGVTVNVKSYNPSVIGDKFCYDSATEVLTSIGWKSIKDITTEDRIASLAGDKLEYLLPVEAMRFAHCGRMYSLETTQASLLVTDNHKLYVQPRGRDVFELLEAKEVFGKRYRLKNNARWIGADPDFIEIAGYSVRCGRGGVATKQEASIRIPCKTYAVLLGAFLSEGNTFNHPKSGSYGIDITQLKGDNVKVFINKLNELGLKYYYNSTSGKFRIYSKHLQRHFSRFGTSLNKYIPNEVFSWSKETLGVIYEWLMWGDGGRTGTGHAYYTSSARLADDFQRLCLHLGMAARITRHQGSKVFTFDKWINKADRYVVSIYKNKNYPTINHGHVKKQGGQTERWVDYNGYVYCVALPRNHVLYVRRNGKSVWCGNSQRFGGKGVAGAIIDDDQMPVDEQGRPIEILLNPLGTISRTNPSAIIESVLGKIAEKTGQPYKIQDFKNIDDLVEFAKGEMQKHGVKDLETLTDPRTGRKIENVLTGKQFFMKLSHMAESKLKGRSIGQGYTDEGVPAKGGETGSMRMALQDTSALLSHGATGILRDAHTVRGAKNEDYWSAFQAGLNPPPPKVPEVYDKFIDHMKAAGINVVRKNNNLHLFALRNQDVDNLAGDRYVENSSTVDLKGKLKPYKGGLFDPQIFGPEGNKWGALVLHEPMPNPVFEDPIRKLLNIKTEEEFNDIISGKKQLNGKSGGEAIKSALAAINVPKEIERARAEIKGSKKTARDAAIKKLGYLKAAQEAHIHPSEWILNKVPILPPKFRPISIMQQSGVPMVREVNHLYAELADANQNLKDMSKISDDLSYERGILYKAFKGVTGLGDPVRPKNRKKEVGGLLKHVFGDNAKFGMMQQKLLSTSVDLVSRGVITPSVDLDMDEVGLPATKAWEIFKPFVIRELVQSGMKNVDAARHVKESIDAVNKGQSKDGPASRALMKVMENRPVIMNRAPILHRYGMMAFKPILHSGSTIQVTPIVTKGFGADFNGDSTISDLTPIMIGDILHLGSFESFIKDYVVPSYEESKAVEMFGNQTTIFELDPAADIKVPGVMSDGAVDWRSVKAVSIHTSHGPDCYRVITERGMDAVFTAHHNFLVLDDNCQLVPTKTTEVKKGSLLPMLFGVDIPVTSYQSVPMHSGLPDLPMTFNNGFWLGHYLGDGSLTGREDTVSHASFNQDLLQIMDKTSLDLSRAKPWYEYSRKFNKNVSVRWTDTNFYNWLYDSFGKNCDGKYLASWMFTAPREFRVGLLAGFVAAEGSREPRTISFEIANRKMALQFQYLMSTLGVSSSINVGKPARKSPKTGADMLPTWVVNINFYAFEKLDIPWPTDSLADKFKRSGKSDTHQQWDIVPYPKNVADWVDELLSSFAGGKGRRIAKEHFKSLPRPKPELWKDRQAHKESGCCTRRFAKKIIDCCNVRYADSIPQFVNNWVQIVDNEKLNWNKIESITKVDRPDVTYDFHIPGSETFCIDGWYLTHNTANIHVPVGADAVREAYEKLLPSRNLFSVRDFKAHYLPQQEFIGGLYNATAKEKKIRPRTFISKEDAIKAYHRGEIGMDHPIQILKD